MSKWKWTTKVGLVVAACIMGFGLFERYQYAQQHGLFVVWPSTFMIIFNFVGWWLLVKWALDSALWLRRKVRPGPARLGEADAGVTLAFGVPPGEVEPPSGAVPSPTVMSYVLEDTPRPPFTPSKNRADLAEELERETEGWTRPQLVTQFDASRAGLVEMDNTAAVMREHGYEPGPPVPDLTGPTKVTYTRRSH